VTSLAPSCMRRLAPTLVGDVIRPGTAKVSRPRSPANPAVIKAPLRSAASTTTTPSASPASVRLRAGKWPASAGMPGGNCDRIAPCDSIARTSGPFSGGYTTSTPHPSTASVRPPAASALRCAAVSIPRARPLTIVTPRASRVFRSRVADCQYSEAAGIAREPEQIRRGALPPRGGVGRDQRSSHRGRLGLRIFADDALPRLLRARQVGETEMAEPDLQERVGRLPWTVLEHLLELGERLTVIALRPVRFPDPVLRVPGERMLGVLRHEVDEVEHGLSMLA